MPTATRAAENPAAPEIAAPEPTATQRVGPQATIPPPPDGYAITSDLPVHPSNIRVLPTDAITVDPSQFQWRTTVRHNGPEGRKTDRPGPAEVGRRGSTPLLQRDFKRLPMARALEVWDAMTPEERGQNRAALVRKAEAEMGWITPAERVKLREQVAAALGQQPNRIPELLRRLARSAKQ